MCRRPSPRPPWTPAWRASRLPTWTPTGRRLRTRRDPVAGVLQQVFQRLRRSPKRVVFAEGEEEQVIRAAASFVHQGLGTALLVGREEPVRQSAQQSRHRAWQGHRDHQCRAVDPQRRLRRLSLRAATAQGLPVPRLPAHGQPGPQHLRRLHGGARRRRRHGHRRDPQLFGGAGGRAPRHRRKARPPRHRPVDGAVARPYGFGRRHRDHRDADRPGARRDRHRGRGRCAPHGLRAARGAARLLHLRPSAGRALQRA